MEDGRTLNTRSIDRPVVTNNFDLTNESFVPPATIQAGSTDTIGQFFVTNTGNVEDRPVVRIDGAEAGQAGWAIRTVPSEMSTLKPGKGMPFDVVATAPDGAENPLGYGILVDTSEPRADSEARNLDPVRFNMQLTTPSVIEGDALQLILDENEPPEQSTDPGSTVAFNGEIFNPTDERKSFNLGFLAPNDPPDGITPILTYDDSDLLAGDRRGFEFDLDVEHTAFASTSIWRLELSDDDGVTQQTVSLTVNQIYNVDVAINETGEIPEEVTPGGDLVIPLVVSNFGNGDDEICIEADLPKGWEPVEPCDDIGPKGDDDDENATWNRTVDFPWTLDVASWAKNDTETIRFHAFSNRSDDATISDELEIELTVVESSVPAINLDTMVVPRRWDAGNGTFFQDTPSCTFGVIPGGSMSFTLNLSNEGNTRADFEMSAESEDDWDIKPESSTKEIVSRWDDDDAWVQEETITVTAPPGLDPEDFIEVDFTLETDGTDDADTITCRFEAAFPDLAVVKSSPFKTPEPHLYADFPATLKFKVWNIGWRETGQEVTVRSTITGPSGFENVTDHVIEPLAAGGTQALSVTFNATEPSGDDEDGYDYLIEVDPDEEITQRDDETTGGAPKEYEGEFRVEDFGIEIIAPPGPTVIPEQQVSFEGNSTAFRIRNTGILPQDLDLLVEMSPAWSPAIEKDGITLPAGETEIIEFSFKTPSNPRTGEAKITISAHHQDVDGLKVEESTRIKVDDDKPPVITGLAADFEHVLLGGTVNFTVDVQDATGVADARLYVVAPDGQSDWVAMEGDERGGTFEAMRQFDQLGFHEVHVWARDQSESNNSADTKDDVLEIEVLTTGRPHIRLLTPENESAVRPGTNLVFTILSARPVVEVNYTLASRESTNTEVYGPIDLEPSNPLHIDTEEWSEGAVRLSLEAQDSAGANASGNFSFQMDATPPEVESIDLNPPGAGSGTEVDVLATVMDNVAVESVVVRFEDADGRAQEWDMENVDENQWTAQIVVPDNPVSVSVIATDTAGNRGYGELASGDPNLDDASQFLPAVPVALVLLAVASVLFVRRRRVEDR